MKITELNGIYVSVENTADDSDDKSPSPNDNKRPFNEINSHSFDDLPVTKKRLEPSPTTINFNTSIDKGSSFDDPIELD